MNVIPANNVLNNQGSKNYYWILLLFTVQAYENNILISKMYGCAEILLTNLYIYKILGCFCKREIITRTTNYGDTNDVQT